MVVSQILPQRGRGTTRWWKGASEKARGSAQPLSRLSLVRPPPSVLRPATSPVGRVSGVPNPTTTVTPAKAGAGLFFSGLAAWGWGAKGSQALDQVRSDDVVREAAE